MRYADKKYKEKFYTVYIHICPNNKKYVGLTCQSPEARWNNGKGYSHQKLFYRAILKYGWQNIQHTIVKQKLTLQDATELEKALIAKYKSNDVNYGYNLTDGGEGTQGYHLTDAQLERHRINSTGRKHTQATKDKLSKMKKGKKLNLTEEQRAACAERARNLPHYKRTVEQRKKMSEIYYSLKNKPVHNKPHTDEAKRKIGEASRARGSLSDETKRKLSDAAKRQWERQKREKVEEQSNAI